MILGADIDSDNDSLIIIMIKTNQNPFAIIFALLYQNDHTIMYYLIRQIFKPYITYLENHQASEEHLQISYASQVTNTSWLSCESDWC